MAHVQSQTDPRPFRSPSTGLSSWAHAYDIQRLPLWGFQAPWTDRGTHPRTKWIF
jgi:hypothetical protein